MHFLIYLNYLCPQFYPNRILFQRQNLGPGVAFGYPSTLKNYAEVNAAAGRAGGVSIYDLQFTIYNCTVEIATSACGGFAMTRRRLRLCRGLRLATEFWVPDNDIPGSSLRYEGQACEITPRCEQRG
jgi:hypothetical protein